ncbi:hypothetical protein ACOMHN_037577 [Nucella lapillus]
MKDEAEVPCVLKTNQGGGSDVEQTTGLIAHCSVAVKMKGHNQEMKNEAEWSRREGSGWRQILVFVDVVYRGELYRIRSPLSSVGVVDESGSASEDVELERYSGRGGGGRGRAKAAPVTIPFSSVPLSSAGTASEGARVTSEDGVTSVEGVTSVIVVTVMEVVTSVEGMGEVEVVTSVDGGTSVEGVMVVEVVTAGDGVTSVEGVMEVEVVTAVEVVTSVEGVTSVEVVGAVEG